MKNFFNRLNIIYTVCKNSKGAKEGNGLKGFIELVEAVFKYM